MQIKNTIRRRDFISQMATGTTASFVALGTLQTLAGAECPSDNRAFHLTVDDFASLVGEWFELEGSSESRVSGRLLQADAIKSAGPRPAHLPRREAFSLVFLIENDQELAQETHAVRHPELGAMPMLLVPISDPRGRCQRVEAVFN